MCVCVRVCVCVCVCVGDLAEGEICGHTQLVQRFKELQRSMLNYVKTRHANGVRWNPNGSPLRQAP